MPSCEALCKKPDYYVYGSKTDSMFSYVGPAKQSTLYFPHRPAYPLAKVKKKSEFWARVFAEKLPVV